MVRINFSSSEYALRLNIVQNILSLRIHITDFKVRKILLLVLNIIHSIPLLKAFSNIYGLNPV